jgi:ribosomal protein L11 methyltransferase
MAELLDCITLTVPDAALDEFESALSSICNAVSFFQNEAEGTWEVSAVKERQAFEADLRAALSLAELLSGVTPVIARSLVPAAGWLGANEAAFPEQLIGQRFAVRGTHITSPRLPGRLTLKLDAGLAFGSGEHESTRGCLRALEHIAKSRRPRNILDLGTGSGVLALAAVKLLRRPVLAADIDARAVRVAAANARLNGVASRIRVVQSKGWMNRVLSRHAPYDLVFANILARPLCAMADNLAAALAPRGTAILAGLLESQARWVLAAHRRAGLVLERRITDGAWTSLVIRKP